MKSHLLFLFLVKCVILISLLCLKWLLGLDGLATKHHTIDWSNSLNLVALWRRREWILMRFHCLSCEVWVGLELLVEKRKPNLLRNIFDLFFEIQATLARTIIFTLFFFPLFWNIFVFYFIRSWTLHFEWLLIEQTLLLGLIFSNTKLSLVERVARVRRFWMLWATQTELRYCWS